MKPKVRERFSGYGEVLGDFVRVVDGNMVDTAGMKVNRKRVELFFDDG